MKVSIHAGLTFQVGQMSSNQYGRADVTFSDIDTDLPLEPQIKAGKKAAMEAYDVALKELDREVEELYGTKE